MCLPLAAGREVGLTGRLVPCSAMAVDAIAACNAALALPDELELDELLDPDFELLELHAARNASAASAARLLRARFTVTSPC